MCTVSLKEVKEEGTVANMPVVKMFTAQSICMFFYLAQHPCTFACGRLHDRTGQRALSKDDTHHWQAEDF